MMSTGFINLRVIETTHRMRVPLRRPVADEEMRLVLAEVLRRVELKTIVAAGARTRVSGRDPAAETGCPDHAGKSQEMTSLTA
jgi:hypothetical protein